MLSAVVTFKDGLPVSYKGKHVAKHYHMAQ
jgi:hypothetical protein